MLTISSMLSIFGADCGRVAFTTLLSLFALAMVQLLDETATAKLLGITCAALRRWRRERRGPNFCRIGRLIRYRLDDLEAFIDENTQRYTNRKESRAGNDAR